MFGTPVKLRPFTQWVGGKGKELKRILPKLPKNIINYYEPFVGGGSVFFSVKAENYFINDLSSELIGVYSNLCKEEFQEAYRSIIDIWAYADLFNYEYRSFGRGKAIDWCDEFLRRNREQIQHKAFFRIFGVSYSDFFDYVKNHLLESKHVNLLIALKQSFYHFFRRMYNDYFLGNYNCVGSALFVFLSQTCFGGIIRRNKEGKLIFVFTPIKISRQLMRDYSYFKSEKLKTFMGKTHVFNSDFESFLRECNPSSDDFIFLDPPYDSVKDFYLGSSFGDEENKRLESFLRYTPSKFMIIIRETPFIRELYSVGDYNVIDYSHEYNLDMRHKNRESSNHLMITNY